MSYPGSNQYLFSTPDNQHFESIMRYVSGLGWYNGGNFIEKFDEWNNSLKDVIGLSAYTYNSRDADRPIKLHDIDVTITDKYLAVTSPPEEPNTDVDPDDYAVPITPTLSSVTVRSVDIPGYDVEDITISIPGEVDIDAYMPSHPGAAPTVSEVVNPTKPDLTLPAQIVLSEITMPAAPPSITEPSMSMIHPGDVGFSDAVNSFSFAETSYSSPLKPLLETALSSILQSGGTGLGADVENALWERARDRVALLKERQYDEALNFFASRGWTIPPGALMGRLEEALTEQTRSDEQLNYEIMIEQARIAKETTQKNIDQILQFESEYIKLNSDLNNRALESAKALHQAAIDTINANIARHNLRLEGFRVASDHYQKQYQVALLSLERWKAELEGKRVEAEVQKILLEAYNSKVQSVKILAELYQVEVDSARLQIEADKIRIEAYKESVSAYTAGIESVVARVNARNSQIEGEAKKADIFKTRVEAYASRVGASKIEADIQLAEIDAQLKANQLLIEKLKAELDKYNTQIGAAVESAKLKGQKYGYNIDLFKAQSGIAEAQVNAEIEVDKIRTDAALKGYDKILKEAELGVQAYLGLNELQKGAMDTAAGVYAQILASIYGIMHASASGSAGGSISYGVSADGGEV